jgi:hypothetical protein
MKLVFTALGFLLIILAINNTPSSWLTVLDHPVFRLGIIALLLIVTSVAPVEFSIAVLLIIALAFIKRNIHKRGAVSILVPGNANASMSTPTSDDITFTPQDDNGSDEYESPSSTLDQKFVPQSAPLGSAASTLF